MWGLYSRYSLYMVGGDNVKRFFIWATMIILAVVLAFLVYYIRLPEYRVYNSISNTGADYREVDMHVIVYKTWDIEKTVEKIVSEYKKMNGVPNQLTVYLYHNKFDIMHGREFYKKVFLYGDNEVTEPPGI